MGPRQEGFTAAWLRRRLLVAMSVVVDLKVLFLRATYFPVADA